MLSEVFSTHSGAETGLSPAVAAFRAKMQTEQAKQLYRTRSQIAEFPHAWIKKKLGLRRFRLRGRQKVRAEAIWACLTYNIQQWIRLILRPSVAVAALQKTARQPRQNLQCKSFLMLRRQRRAWDRTTGLFVQQCQVKGRSSRALQDDFGLQIANSFTLSMTARISLILGKMPVIDRAYRCFFTSFATPSFEAI